MAGPRRIERLNELLREEISRLLRTELKDPRVAAVTVTGVRTSSDLSSATVYVTTPGAESGEEAIEGLRHAAGFVRGRLGRELRLRRIPELRFVEDRTLEHARRIEALLEEASGPTDPDAPDAG